jgi:hypothetical protein
VGQCFGSGKSLLRKLHFFTASDFFLARFGFVKGSKSPRGADPDFYKIGVDFLTIIIYIDVFKGKIAVWR